jgi:hypothetical protein
VRALLDAFLAFSLAANLVLLATSIAGYGVARLARWIPHLPCEFAAPALTGAAYLLARRAPLPARQLLLTAALALVLFEIAATLEAYAVPHR